MVETLTVVEPRDLADIRGLVRELSKTASLPGEKQVANLIAQPEVDVFVARDSEGAVIGCLVLRFSSSLTGVRAHIDDVVVHQHARGSGVGRRLVEAAVQAAKRDPAVRSVDLTSAPQRTAARHLYRSTGFELRDSDVFRLDLSLTRSSVPDERPRLDR